jgi:hypothetical protein
MKLRAAFATESGPERTTKYNFIKTSDIMGILMTKQWLPKYATETKVRVQKEDRQDFAKHMIVFQNPVMDKIDNCVPQIALFNSHNGTCPFQLVTSMYQPDLDVELIIPNKRYGHTKVRHSSKAMREIETAIDNIPDMFEKVRKLVVSMKKHKLDEEQKLEFSKHILDRLYPRLSPEDRPFTPESLCSSRRENDIVDTLYSAVLVITENVVKGGIIAKSPSGKERMQQSITNIGRLFVVNRIIWQEVDVVLLNMKENLKAHAKAVKEKAVKKTPAKSKKVMVPKLKPGKVVEPKTEVVTSS